MDKYLNLRSHRSDHTLSFTRDSRGRTQVSLSPDDPLTYGYDDAGTSIDELSMHRLRHWLLTGEALKRTDPRLLDGPAPVLDRVRAVLDGRGVTADVYDGDSGMFDALVADLAAALDPQEPRPETPEDSDE